MFSKSAKEVRAQYCTQLSAVKVGMCQYMGASGDTLTDVVHSNSRIDGELKETLIRLMARFDDPSRPIGWFERRTIKKEMRVVDDVTRLCLKIDFALNQHKRDELPTQQAPDDAPRVSQDRKTSEQHKHDELDHMLPFNPATGLLMMGMFDIGGNLYGFNNHSGINADHDVFGDRSVHDAVNDPFGNDVFGDPFSNDNF